MIPLVLLIVFNRFVIDTVKLDVPTAMFISFTVALCCELARKAVKDVLNTGFEFFHMMGRQFATVITLIVAAKLFAKASSPPARSTTSLPARRTSVFRPTPS